MAKKYIFYDYLIIMKNKEMRTDQAQLNKNLDILISPDLHLVGHTSGISIIRLTPDSRYAISGSMDQTICI